MVGNSRLGCDGICRNFPQRIQESFKLSPSLVGFDFSCRFYVFGGVAKVEVGIQAMYAW